MEERVGDRVANRQERVELVGRRCRHGLVGQGLDDVGLLEGLKTDGDGVRRVGGQGARRRELLEEEQGPAEVVDVGVPQTGEDLTGREADDRRLVDELGIPPGVAQMVDDGEKGDDAPGR